MLTGISQRLLLSGVVYADELSPNPNPNCISLFFLALLSDMWHVTESY